MENNFLAINKEYFNLGLKSIDILILAQIDEFNRNDCQCYVTNQQLSDMFGESVRTITRSLDKLEERKFIQRNTITSKTNGQSSKIRTININYNVLKASAKMTSALGMHNEKEVSKVAEANAKNLKRKCQNGTIKEKEKENKKDNTGCNNNFSSKKEKYNINLPNIDKLIDTLKNKNINCTHEEIVFAYNEVQNSNCVKEYKWDCEELERYVQNEYHSDNLSFQNVLKEYDRCVTTKLDSIYGFAWGDD